MRFYLYALGGGAVPGALQHLAEERGDTARDVGATGIQRDIQQLRVVGEHPLIVRHRPVAPGGVAEEPALDGIAQR